LIRAPPPNGRDRELVFVSVMHMVLSVVFQKPDIDASTYELAITGIQFCAQTSYTSARLYLFVAVWLETDRIPSFQATVNSLKLTLSFIEKATLHPSFFPFFLKFFRTQSVYEPGIASDVAETVLTLVATGSPFVKNTALVVSHFSESARKLDPIGIRIFGALSHRSETEEVIRFFRELPTIIDHFLKQRDPVVAIDAYPASPMAECTEIPGFDFTVVETESRFRDGLPIPDVYTQNPVKELNAKFPPCIHAIIDVIQMSSKNAITAFLTHFDAVTRETPTDSTWDLFVVFIDCLANCQQHPMVASLSQGLLSSFLFSSSQTCFGPMQSPRALTLIHLAVRQSAKNRRSVVS
jgi:hypothetical protein